MDKALSPVLSTVRVQWSVCSVNAIMHAASKNLLLPASSQSRDLIQFLVEQMTPSEPVSKPEAQHLLPSSPAPPLRLAGTL